MDRDDIIRVLEEKRDQLNQAIAALGVRQPRGARTGNGRKRQLSPQERKRISEGMRKSWAKRAKRKKKS
jgi:hypothetical protein